MPQILSKSRQNTVPSTQSFGSDLSAKIAITSNNNPVAIGTRGTVGSLIMQEIDYFIQLELDNRSSASNKTYNQVTTDVSSKSEKKKSKKKRYIPSICSKVEVSERNLPNSSTSRFTYKNLKKPYTML
ncbi:hypothetical protein ACP275_08G182100 [Erythranthe tilingii]